MNEEEWLASDDPHDMLSVLGGNSPRKLRLFALASCQRVEEYVTSPDLRLMLRLIERDIETRSHQLNETVDAHNAACEAAENAQLARSRIDATETTADATTAIIRAAISGHCLNHNAEYAEAWERACEESQQFDGINCVDDDLNWDAERNERFIQTMFLRDIFGNPFRPVNFDPTWRTDDVLGLARAIYEERAFDRMSILADALMDAGCEDEQILSHCRSDGPHVRGCWVVDLILGKE